MLTKKSLPLFIIVLLSLSFVGCASKFAPATESNEDRVKPYIYKQPDKKTMNDFFARRETGGGGETPLG